MRSWSGKQDSFGIPRPIFRTASYHFDPATTVMHSRCREPGRLMLKKRAPKIGPGAKVGLCSAAGAKEPELVGSPEEIWCGLTAVHPPPRSAPTARATPAAPTSAPLLGLARGRTAMVHAACARKRKGKPSARRSSYPSGPPTLEKLHPSHHPNFLRRDHPLVGLERSRRVRTRPAQWQIQIIRGRNSSGPELTA
jgi:hypothetical protein